MRLIICFTCIEPRGGYARYLYDLSLNLSDLPCGLHVVHEVECLIVVSHIHLYTSEVIIRCCVVDIFRVYYADICMFSIHFTSCIYILLLFK